MTILKFQPTLIAVAIDVKEHVRIILFGSNREYNKLIYLGGDKYQKELRKRLKKYKIDFIVFMPHPSFVETKNQTGLPRLIVFVTVHWKITKLM